MAKESFTEVTVRVMCDADLFYLKKWLMDPVVLGWFPMSNINEVEDALKVWQTYARQACAFTAEVNGVPCGVVNLYVQPYEKLRYQSLFAIVVGEEHRGKGIGTKLLKHIMREAKNTFGIQLLHLEVYEGNPAYNLYYRLGFRPYGKHEKFLKEADGSYHSKVLMQIDLNSSEV